MALVSTSDWQHFAYALAHSIENSVGLDLEQLVRHEGVSQADIITFLADYRAWAQANLPKRVDGTFTTTSH
jgi:hypothetical protein